MSDITYSVIIPTLNEQNSIRQCIDSLLSAAPDNDPCKLEIIIIDGLSTDNTRNIATEYINKTSVVRLVDNPNQSTPAGFNIGFDEATNEIIVLMSGHARVASNFFDALNSLFTSPKLNADVIGPRALPIGNGYVQTGIAGALASRLGAASSRFESVDGYVDTVAYGAYRREVIEEVGKMDLSLVRGQDYEYNQRVCKTGYNIYQTSDTYVSYYPRDNLRSLFEQKFGNGKARAQIYHNDHPSALLTQISKHSPLSILLVGVLALISPLIMILSVTLCLYSLVIVAVSCEVIGREDWLTYKHLPSIFVALVTIHAAFAIGFLFDIVM
jgi:glycosyltransferase involved in cell wall biosynthesis